MSSLNARSAEIGFRFSLVQVFFPGKQKESIIRVVCLNGYLLPIG